MEEVGGWLRLYSRRWLTLHLGRCRGLTAAGGKPKAGGRGVSQSRSILADATRAHFRNAAWARVHDGLNWMGARSHLCLALSALG